MGNEVTQEQEYVLTILNQMKEMHKDNKSVQSTLEFIEDCIRNRMGVEENAD